MGSAYNTRSEVLANAWRSRYVITVQRIDSTVSLEPRGAFMKPPGEIKSAPVQDTLRFDYCGLLPHYKTVTEVGPLDIHQTGFPGHNSIPR